MQIQVEHLEIPFRLRIKQASADRRAMQSIWVEARDRDSGPVGLGEGCPRSYQTGEDVASALAWIGERREDFAGLADLGGLRGFVAAHERELDEHPAAWCAVELALLDLFARRRGCSVEALLGVPEGLDRFRYAAVISDERGDRLRSLVSRFLAAGLRDFKFKLSGQLDADIEKLELIRELGPDVGLRVRVDANNLWHDADAAIAHLSQLPGPIAALEEPLQPGMLEGMAAVSRALSVAVVLDESLLRPADVEEAARLDAAWIGNVKISRCGGVLRSLELIRALRDAGWPILIGSQTGETSVLTRAALVGARAAGDALWGQEGALGTLLLERDPVEPELRLGEGGYLSIEAAGLGGLGWGLERVRSSP